MQLHLPSAIRAALFSLVLFAAPQTALAGGAALPVLDIDFQVESLTFSGGGLMPLGPDFTEVLTAIEFTATSGSGNLSANGDNDPIQDGDQLFFENTTLSLGVDIVLTDVDDTVDFAGGQSTLSLLGIGIDLDDVAFVPNCIADTSQPFVGCGMVLNDNFNEGDTTTLMGNDYDLVSATVPISLGQDADGQGGLDEITGMFLELAFSGPLETTEQGGVTTQTWEIDAIWSGEINPPFLIGGLSGSATTTTTSDPGSVPEPGTAALLLIGGAGLAWGMRRRR